jgi:molybdopterin-guanine dinucleotide biosynthesis protein A
MTDHTCLSAIVLAGGGSKRMGSDKAFLLWERVPFVGRVASEVAKVSDDVVVMIGTKREKRFNAVLGSNI